MGLLIAYSSKVLIYFTSISTDFSQVEEKNPAGTKEDGMGNAVERCFMFLFLLASLLRLTKTNMTRNEDVTSNKLLEGERDKIAQGSRCLLGGGHVQSVLSARAIRNYPPLSRTLAFHRFCEDTEFSQTSIFNWRVVSNPSEENAHQIGSFPQVGVKF